MGGLFVLLFLLSPVLLVVGLVNPSLFKRMLGKVPSRVAVAKLSAVLFVGSFIGAGMTLDPVKPIEATEPTTTEEAQVEEPVSATLEKSLPETKAVEETAPKNEPIQETTVQTVEPQVEVQEETYTYTPPVVETAPEPVVTTPSYICSYNAYNCSDFSSWYEANQVYNYCISIGAGDIHDLDRDNDGACDSLK